MIARPLGALALTLLAGCSAVGGLTGAAASFATAVATANPVIGLTVGIGVKAATDATVKTVQRRRQQTEQDAIATAVSDMQPGESRVWHARHIAGTGTEHGEVRVVRAFETPLATCKEILFSVIDGDDANATRAWFATTACLRGDRWKWAAAEPAVERWGSLQ